MSDMWALVCRLLLEEGDSVVVTAPTYITGIPILRSHGAEFVEVAQDAEGLDVEELRAAVVRLKREGRPLPKFIYDVLDFQNPTGITMTRQRREAVVELAATRGIFFVEDSPYRRIRFEGQEEPCLKSLDHEGWVISLGSFAKLLAPGLRIGWAVASSDMVGRLGQLKSDGGSCPLPADGGGNTSMFPRTLPDRSPGGYYLWLPLPVGVSGDELTSAAPGRACSCTRAASSTPSRIETIPTTIGLPRATSDWRTVLHRSKRSMRG